MTTTHPYKTIARTQAYYQKIDSKRSYDNYTRLHLEWNGRNIRLIWKDYLDCIIPDLHSSVTIDAMGKLFTAAYKKPMNVDTEEEKEKIRVTLKNLKEKMQF